MINITGRLSVKHAKVSVDTKTHMNANLNIARANKSKKRCKTDTRQAGADTREA
jgi:hypothetical protein